MPTTKTVKVLPDSELSVQLKAAETSGEPVVVDTGEGIYTLLVSRAAATPQDVFAQYDPHAAIAGLHALQRALEGVDRASLLRDLREQREQDSSGRPA